VQYRLVVVNRLSPSNLSKDLHSALDFSLKAPYLMFRDKRAAAGNAASAAQVTGIWFSSEAELGAISAHVTRLVKTLKAQEAAGASAPGNARAASSAAPQPGAFPVSAAAGAATSVGGDPGRHILSMVQGPVPTPPAAPAAAAAMPAAVAALFQQQAKPLAAAAPQSMAPQPIAQSEPHLLTPTLAAMAAAPVPAPAVAAAPALAQSAAGGLLSELAGAVGTGAAAILLNRQQLQAVLQDLLQDDDFIGKIHARYVETITQKMLAGGARR
jgi:hypothetical protein